MSWNLFARYQEEALILADYSNETDLWVQAHDNIKGITNFKAKQL